MDDLQKFDFNTFVLSISSAALVGLGLAPSEGPTPAEINLDLARHNIDLLELLKEKTRGNLTPQESKLLESLLYETRLRYVEVSKNEKTKK